MNSNINETVAQPPLVDADGLLWSLFGDKSNQPGRRWLQYQVARKIIPAYRISGLTRFDVSMVRAALEKNCLVGVAAAKTTRQKKGIKAGKPPATEAHQ